MPNILIIIRHHRFMFPLWRMLIRNGRFFPHNGTTEINSRSPLYNNFAGMFDTISHELTHRYQASLVSEFRAGGMPDSDERYQVARLLSSANFALMNKDTSILSPRFTPDFMYFAYRNSPEETQAFARGMEAGRHIR